MNHSLLVWSHVLRKLMGHSYSPLTFIEPECMLGTAQAARAWNSFCPHLHLWQRQEWDTATLNTLFSFRSLSSFNLFKINVHILTLSSRADIQPGLTTDPECGLGQPWSEYRDQILEYSGHSLKICWKNGEVNELHFTFKPGNHRTTIKTKEIWYVC